MFNLYKICEGIINSGVRFLTCRLLFMLTFFSYLHAQESKVWDYPIHSGTSEWGKLKTYKEKLKALNILDSMLLKMSTKDLLDRIANSSSEYLKQNDYE